MKGFEAEKYKFKNYRNDGLKMELICLQIDLARQKESVEYIKSYIDFAKECGYNALIVYLENSIRTEDTAFFKEEESYSPEEISLLVAYAEERGIDVIPAFENLGHLEKFMQYPPFADISECIDGPSVGRGLYPFELGTCGCTSNPRLYEVMDKYVADVCKLFHSKYVHMGLDEPFDFAVCARCKAEIQKGKTKADLFYEHVMHSYELVKSMGKTMLMWDDFFEYADIADRLPRDIVLCNWNYYFVADIPSGHWTNRVRKDWFAYYEQLGFQYMFCAYANGGSCTYNVDTLTEYAEKYHPIGAILTSWEKYDCFYLGTYPLIAYAGKKWNGKIQSERDRIAVYQAIVGSKTCAESLLSLQMPSFYGGYTDVDRVCENDNLAKMVLRNSICAALPLLKKSAADAQGLQKDIVTDIYDYYLGISLGLRLEKLGTKIFDFYETNTVQKEYLLEQLDELICGYEELEKNERLLWEKYRHEIISCNGAFDKKHKGNQSKLLGIRACVEKSEGEGVLYADLMLHDGFGTPRVEIWGKYDGEDAEKLIYKGGIKSSTVGFELGGCYTLRVKTENKKLEYIIFSLWGESALYPMYFRHASNGKKTIVCKVERQSGYVENEKNLLYNDTRFATMGYDDGMMHFNNVELSKERNQVKIFFE